MKKKLIFGLFMVLLLVAMLSCKPAPAQPAPGTTLPGNETTQTQQPSGLMESLVGQAAPDLSLSDLGGKTISLSDLKGQVVLLNFWATW